MTDLYLTERERKKSLITDENIFWYMYISHYWGGSMLNNYKCRVSKSTKKCTIIHVVVWIKLHLNITFNLIANVRSFSAVTSLWRLFFIGYSMKKHLWGVECKYHFLRGSKLRVCGGVSFKRGEGWCVYKVRWLSTPPTWYLQEEL